MAFHEALPYIVLSESPALLAQVIDIVLGPLLRRPNPRGSIETLRAFLSPGTQHEATKRLHIHRSTLTQRITGIERLTGLSVRSEELLYHLALCAYDMTAGEGRFV